MTKRQKRGCLLILAGLVMVFCALGLHQVQEEQDRIAGENARILLQHLELNRVTVEQPPQQTPQTPDPQDPGREPQELPEPTLPPAPQKPLKMPEKTYLGYSMLGTVRVPSVGIELPVLSDWSYELLNVAPCRYSGSIPDRDMILMGHNYRSHFTPLHQVQVGDAVEFVDVNGLVYRFRVAAIEYLRGYEGEKLPSGYPLTLFTCTPGGESRIVVRCVEIGGLHTP